MSKKNFVHKKRSFSRFLKKIAETDFSDFLPRRSGFIIFFFFQFWTKNICHNENQRECLGSPFKKKNYLYQSSDIVIFLGKNEENKFCGFSQKDPLKDLADYGFGLPGCV